MKTCVISDCTAESARRQRGLVAVELAITLPLVILIMFATAELGRAFYQYTTLAKAVEAGARYYASAVNDLTIVETDKIPTTKNLVVSASPDGTGAAVLPLFSKNDVEVGPVLDDHVRVSAKYDFKPIIGKLPIINKVIGEGLKLTVTHSMRVL